jgi:hypothetical protein
VPGLPETTVHFIFFAQSASAAQLDLHELAAASQAYGAQSVRAVDCVHEPAAQVGGGLRRSCPSQTAAPQRVPSAIGEHVPCLPAIAHELQLVQAAAPQQ